MNNKASNIEFIEHFSGKDTFTKKEISLFYASTGLKLTDNALRWRIYRLTEQGLIMSVGRSVYSLKTKPRFLQEPDKFTKKIIKLFQQKFEVDYCIWDTKILHNFMLHQPFRFFYILETDKDVTETTFYHLKDNNIKAFLNPSIKIMEEYVMGENDVVILKPLISRPPLSENKKIIVPELEKVLVDIFCDQHQFFMFGGQEMIYIYENAINHYNINFTSLYAYAGRRGKREIIENYINDKILG